MNQTNLIEAYNKWKDCIYWTSDYPIFYNEMKTLLRELLFIISDEILLNDKKFAKLFNNILDAMTYYASENTYIDISSNEYKQMQNDFQSFKKLMEQYINKEDNLTLEVYNKFGDRIIYN